MAQNFEALYDALATVSTDKKAENEKLGKFLSVSEITRKHAFHNSVEALREFGGAGLAAAL